MIQEQERIDLLDSGPRQRSPRNQIADVIAQCRMLRLDSP
jgi:hypothetical protein